MMDVRRLILLGLLGIFASPAGLRAEGDDVTPLREDKAALAHYEQLENMDFGYSPERTLPSRKPFSRIIVEVHGPYDGDEAIRQLGQDIAKLDGYALHHIQVRLKELGVADDVKVGFVSGDNPFSPDYRTLACQTVRVSFKFDAIQQSSGDGKTLSMAVTLLATQSAEGYDSSGKPQCMAFGPLRLRMAGPLQFAISGEDVPVVLQEVRARIVRLVDYEIVPLILGAYHAASVAVRGWQNGSPIP